MNSVHTDANQTDDLRNVEKKEKYFLYQLVSNVFGSERFQYGQYQLSKTNLKI
ncbi:MULTISPECIES: hypothetical protein [unclassified Bartonella]|uniref:hypothetical protein n=1 Tax=unclassified Bartonella TaxID=2645622 RepID=UPI0009C28F52|nr:MULTISPECIES: hypothetical protein [unclassified Bartonella]AQX18997.1 hypothetical protein BA1379B_011970 [Bartonella sp. A1379B]AQX22221.1 hypothetical protein Bho11B_001910 [Bartonella sp. 11B]AQX24496.1 hypothetical protein Bho114_011850 [Bartonella sp. 114]AQX25990.1 hypothetical protein Bco22_013470 [Bartonella sp. Coyote22sub2]